MPYELTWEQGRQLKEIKEGEKRYRYTYNADGIRTRKEANGITHEYYLSGSMIIGERRTGEGTDVLLTYHYDINGISGFRYRNNVTGASKRVYYRKNIQGDIIGILDGEGETLVTYVYDAWGNILLSSGNAELQRLNPFMYRGYYRDTETGWYYLNSRYYDASVCRFLNADDIGYIDPESLNGLNMYVYCGNNPVMGYDPEGNIDWGKAKRVLLVALIAIAAIALVAAVTVASGGTLAPVFISAGIGFGISGGLSAFSQLASTGTVDWYQVATDGLIGAVTGALGGSTFNLAGMAASGAAIGFGGSVASDYVAGNDINWGAAVQSGIIGGLLGMAAGPGAQYGKTGGVRAAQSTRREIITRYKQGGYRSKTNYDFGMKSNLRRLNTQKRMLSRSATMDVILGIPLNIKLEALQYGILLN